MRLPQRKTRAGTIVANQTKFNCALQQNCGENGGAQKKNCDNHRNK